MNGIVTGKVEKQEGTFSVEKEYIANNSSEFYMSGFYDLQTNPNYYLRIIDKVGISHTMRLNTFDTINDSASIRDVVARLIVYSSLPGNFDLLFSGFIVETSNFLMTLRTGYSISTCISKVQLGTIE